MVFLFVSPMQAQGLLGKLKEKTNANTNGNSKETEKDSLAQDLEKLSFKKDRNGLSGIYFFQKALVHNGNDQGWGPTQTKFKKVLVEVDADKGYVWMRTRNWEDDLFGKLLFSMGDESWVKDLAKSNIMSGLDGSSVQENMRYHYLDLEKIVSDGKPEMKPFKMNNVSITLLEPGVFALHTSIKLEKV